MPQPPKPSMLDVSFFSRCMLAYLSYVLYLSISVVEPLWFAAVPVPTLKKFWFRFQFRLRIQTIFSFVNKKNCTNVIALFPRRLASHFWFFYIFIPFYVRSGTETVMHSGSNSAKVKSYGSCGSGSGSTTLLNTFIHPKKNLMRLSLEGNLTIFRLWKDTGSLTRQTKVDSLSCF